MNRMTMCMVFSYHSAMKSWSQRVLTRPPSFSILAIIFSSWAFSCWIRFICTVSAFTKQRASRIDSYARRVLIWKLIIEAGSKTALLDKMHFQQPIEFFLPKCQDLQRKDFATVLENFIAFHRCFRLFYNILFRISKLCRRNGQSF